jgi:predicted small secreted protein
MKIIARLNLRFDLRLLAALVVSLVLAACNNSGGGAGY